MNSVILTGLTECFSPRMLEQGRGRILNVASAAVSHTIHNMAAYAPWKAYVLHHSEALAEELVGTEVRVFVLCPGIIAIEFGRRDGVEILLFLIALS